MKTQEKGQKQPWLGNAFLVFRLCFKLEQSRNPDISSGARMKAAGRQKVHHDVLNSNYDI